MNEKKTWIMMLAMASAASVHATLIIGGTVKNGNFEAGFGPTTGQRTFEQVNTWWNAGTGGQSTYGANDNLGDGILSTGYNAIVNDNGLDGNAIHSANTGYFIQSGDYFQVAFNWRDASGWENGDVIQFRLMATDNNALNGNIVWSQLLTANPRTSVGTWESASLIGSAVGAAAVGRNLFVQFYGVTGQFGTEGDFARVDNVVVQAIPEPATLGLLTGLGGSILFLRRIFLV